MKLANQRGSRITTTSNLFKLKMEAEMGRRLYPAFSREFYEWCMQKINEYRNDHQHDDHSDEFGQLEAQIQQILDGW